MSDGDILPDIIGSGGQKREVMPVTMFGLDGEPVISGEGGAVDTANGTNTALSADAEFTGEWVTDNNPQIAFNIISDQPGTLYVEFSPDGGSTLSLSKPYACFADQANFDALVKMPGRSHRIRYVNGTNPQTEFALLTATGGGLFPYVKSDRDEPIFFAQTVKDVDATEYRIIVDLSDNVTFPHYDIGGIELYASYLQVDKDVSGRSAVRLGVITRIDGTDADIAFVQGVSFDKSADRRIVRDRDFRVPIKLGQSGGALTKAVTGVVTTGITAVNTGATLSSPLGSVTPAVGDLIAQYEHAAGTFDASIAGFYAGKFSTT